MGCIRCRRGFRYGLWVLSPPHALRYRVAYDSPLLAALIRIFIRAISSWLRRRARERFAVIPSLFEER